MLRIDGKLVSEAADLAVKNREVWVVEATYELQKGDATEEITVTDLEAHLTSGQIASLPWHISIAQPNIHFTYIEQDYAINDALKASFIATGSDADKKPDDWVFSQYQNNLGTLSSASLENVFGSKYNVTDTRFIPVVNFTFDSAELHRFSDVARPVGSSSVGNSIVNSESIDNYKKATIKVEPWEVSQEYYFHTWTESEWTARANTTTATPYWHYTLKLAYNQAGWGFAKRNEDLKCLYNGSIEPLFTVTTELAYTSGSWTGLSDLSSLQTGTYILPQTEWNKYDVLFNKSTTSKEYKEMGCTATANASTLTSPVALDYDGAYPYNLNGTLTGNVAYYYFITSTPVDLITNLMYLFGFTESFIKDKLLIF